MEQLDLMKLIILVDIVAQDERTTIWHLGLLVAIMQVVCKEKANPVAVSRSDLMKLSCINSIATYHKCMKQLVVFGYIVYRPSYHPGIRTMVKIVF